MITRVLAYLRVSTAQQVEGDGFDRQQAACRKLAEKMGWHIARTFEEQQSGSVDTMDRPKLFEALNLCGGDAGYNIIIVERVGRIARDLIVAELFFRECKKRGVKVYAADTGEEMVDAEGDPTRKLIRQILGALEEWDKAQICLKLQAGRRKKKHETGKPCGGSYPYGDPVNPALRRHQQETIRSIMRWIRIDGHSLSMVARILSIQKIRNPHGGDKWARSTIAHIYKTNQFRTKFDAL